MLHDLIFFLLGLALIVAGGNYVTDGASAVARRFRVSNLVIGLTVVAFGSSMPDLVVCLTSTLTGRSELALGDVVGSNIFDMLLAVGVVAMVRPISLSSTMLRQDLPMLALASVMLFVCGDDVLFDGAAVNTLDRTDGLMLLGFFVIFMCYTLSAAKLRSGHPHPVDCSPKGSQMPQSVDGSLSTRRASAASDEAPGKVMNMWLAAGAIIGGLAALVVGGDWLVDGASGIARRWGMSEGMVGLTIVAIGGAAPDLATSLIAALKKQPGIALGNVVGACIFNIFFIMGVCGTVSPLDAGTITIVDFATLAGAALLLWLFGGRFGHRVINRWEGAILTLAYIAYMTYVIITGLP